MEAVIANFRMGRHTKSSNNMIIKIASLTTREKAQSYEGKKVTWTSPAGKKIEGKVAGAHGNSGALRVIFEKGMPGQAIGSKVKVE